MIGIGIGLGLGPKAAAGFTPPAQHTDGLISEWLFAEGSGATVNDEIGSNHINLDGPATPNYTWNARGVELAAGLIQTPSIPSARTVAMLYKTNRDGKTGFLISGGATGGSGIIQEIGTTTEKVDIGGGYGVHPLAKRADNGAGAYELNRGGYVLLFRELTQAYTTLFGFGGRHSTTTSRCDEFEIVWAGVWDDALTDAERTTVYEYVAHLSKQRGVYLKQADCPSRPRAVLLGGESTADGRSPISGLSGGDQAQVFAKTYIQTSNGTAAGADMAVPALFDLGTNQQATSPATDFGPELGFAQSIEAGSETVYLIKLARGSTFLAPSNANGLNLPASSFSWNEEELHTSGLFWQFMRHFYDAEQSSRLNGIGLEIVGLQFLIGLNDAIATAYTVDAATYRSRLEAMIAAIKTYSGLSSLPVHLPRAHNHDPSADATAIEHVRDAQATFVAEWADGATLLDTDGYTLFDGTHFDAAGSLAIGAAGYQALLT